MKRFLALFLCVFVTLTLLPSAALAVETFTTSEEGIAMIKEFEDFRSEAYQDDRGNWYIGYGLACDPADYPGGISEAEGDRLMREDLVEKEDAINKILMENGVSINQQQFDALASLTYTLGRQWMSEDARLYNYLIDGIDRYTDAEIVNAIATWCHVGSEPMEALVRRRLQEAYLFLYGVYDNPGASEYAYIHFTPNGGTVENQTVFYPVLEPYGELPVPARKGYLFQGWFDENGVRLTGEEPAQGGVYVTARWEAEEPEIDLSAWVNPYSDVKESDWFYSYVRELSAKDVVAGYLDGTFQPDRTLTAGEALKLLLRAAGHPDPGNAPAGHWAETYLAQAVGLGCVEPEEIEDLDGAISRGLIARIAAVAMGWEWREGLSPFADIDTGYALTLYEEGIITGEISGGQRWFFPDESISRAEMSAIVSRISGWAPVNDPAQSGYIEFRNKQIPVLRDATPHPYNLNLFVQDGTTAYYNDPDYETELGVDVSRHQGDVNWEKVAASGISFAMIRIGGRLADSGEIYDDIKFEENLTGAQAAGLKTGVYFYSQAISVAEAEEEARYILEKLGGRGLEYPIVFDWEIYSNTARSYGVSMETLTQCAIAFCDLVEEAGYHSMIYMGLEVGYERLDLSRLTDYDFWFAQYTSKGRPGMYYDFRIWQYSDKGKVPGIDGNVDMDIALRPYY